MWMFTLAISCLTTSNLPWFIALMFQVPYAILLFIASDFNSISSHIHNRVLFVQWLHLFILSGVISSLISSIMLGTYHPGEFIFQRPIFLPFHTVHGVLKGRILKWFAITFSSGPRFVRNFWKVWLSLKNIFCSGCLYLGFPGDSDDKESACNAGDPGSTPGLGRPEPPGKARTKGK